MLLELHTSDIKNLDHEKKGYTAGLVPEAIQQEGEPPLWENSSETTNTSRELPGQDYYSQINEEQNIVGSYPGNIEQTHTDRSLSPSLSSQDTGDSNTTQNRAEAPRI